MAKWEELTMADRSLYFLKHDRTLGYRKDITKIHQALLNARKFTVSNRAAERLGDSMGNYPEYIALNSEFAIPPFPIMWVEFDSIKMLHKPLLSPDMRGDADHRVGYLIINNTVVVFAEGKTREPVPGLIDYHLHRPMTIQSELVAANWFLTSRMGLDPFLWGHTMSEYLDPDIKRMLRYRHSLSIHPKLLEMVEKNPEGHKRTAPDVYRGSAGELRNILGILLMINQPAKLFHVREEPRKRGFVRGKQMPYFGHSNIDINIDRKRRINLLSKPTGNSFTMRWHEVIGHFCHNLEGRDSSHHPHVWIEYEPRRWHCAVPGCDGRRWWREYPNGHGSGAKGYVYQQRRIMTSADKRQLT